MKKLALLTVLFTLSLVTVAQEAPFCIQEISLNSDCNRTWNNNNNRFYTTIWSAMMKGDLKIYSKDAPFSESPQVLSSSALYRQFYLEDSIVIMDEMVIYSPDDYIPPVLKGREDSLSYLQPKWIRIYLNKASSSNQQGNKKEWISFVSPTYDGQRGYTFSYDEVYAFLEKTKSYWVNSFEEGDSVLFSTALKEERYDYTWADGEGLCNSSNGHRFADQILNDPKSIFVGNVTRNADLNHKTNRPFYDPRSGRNIANILIKGFLNGKIQGYKANSYGTKSFELLTPEQYQKLYLEYTLSDYIEYSDSGYEEAIAVMDSSYYLVLDAIKVGYKVRLNGDESFDTEKPYLITLCYGPEFNIRGISISMISFDFDEAMALLDASKLMWYASDNHADSSTLGTAIRTNRLFWDEAIVMDLNSTYVYTAGYSSDSSAVWFSSEDESNACIKKVQGKTGTFVKKRMNVTYANQPIPSKSGLPIFLKFKGTRVLDQYEDASLTYLPALSEYIVNKATAGQITIFFNDSLNSKISNAEFKSRMLLTSYSEDEEGREVVEVDSLRPDEFYVCNVSTMLTVNAKGKVAMKNRAIELRIPSELNQKGIEIPLATFSYDELLLLMKKDKKGKELLKQLDASLKVKKCKMLFDPYGNAVFDYWNEEYFEDTIQRAPASLRPYLLID